MSTFSPDYRLYTRLDMRTYIRKLDMYKAIQRNNRKKEEK